MAEKTRTPRVDRGQRSPLLREQAVYEANRASWLSDHEGEHVLIKGEDVCGFFASRDDALTAGYARFGVVPLLVKQVLAVERVFHVPNADV